MSPMEMAYRKLAAGTSGFGLLIALYDTLAGNLRRATEAECNNDIERRCKEVNHALLVIGYLEDRLSHGNGGALADQLQAFYKSMRRKLIEAQANRSAELIEGQMALVLEIRGQWQAMEFKCEPCSGPEILAPAQTQRYAAPLPVQMEHRQLSWSA